MADFDKNFIACHFSLKNYFETHDQFYIYLKSLRGYNKNGYYLDIKEKAFKICMLHCGEARFMLLKCNFTFQQFNFFFFLPFKLIKELLSPQVPTPTKKKKITKSLIFKTILF